MVAVFVLLGACTSEKVVSVEPTGPDASATPVTSTTPVTSAPSVAPTDAPSTTAPGPATTQTQTGAEPPTGDTIIAVPGSVTIVRSGANATVEITDCGGNGAAGTITIDGAVTNIGETIDRGSVTVQMVDTTGAIATVVARLTSVGSGVRAPLDFETGKDDSPARAIGEVAACWFDSVSDVTFFTTF
jgi:hypothetical protein